MKTPSRKEKQRELMKGLSFLSQIGISMAACVAIGVFLGKFLDGLFGTEPWLLLVFSLLGAAAALKALHDIGMKK